MSYIWLQSMHLPSRAQLFFWVGGESRRIPGGRAPNPPSITRIAAHSARQSLRASHRAMGDRHSPVLPS
jgi:hypothetical protein